MPGTAGRSGGQAPPTSGTGAGAGTTSKAPGGTKPVDWDVPVPEMIAVCRQGQKSGKWECNGSLDNQIIVDEPTLESALERQDCKGGMWVVGGPVLKGQKWEAYACGHALGPGDYDVVKRYDLHVARRMYICPKSQYRRCDNPYTGQDKIQAQ